MRLQSRNWPGMQSSESLTGVVGSVSKQLAIWCQLLLGGLSSSLIGSSMGLPEHPHDIKLFPKNEKFKSEVETGVSFMI